jgi:Tfp pilus assembly protein PilW
MNRRRGFTLVETLAASLIAMYIFLCAWAMYMIVWTWWYEIAPHSECQRIARLAVSTISEGMIDATAGTDTVDFVTYGRRRGSGWAARSSSADIYPTITDDGPDTGHRINFKLESDPVGSNVRSFYLGQDANGVGAVYYVYGNNAPQIVTATLGINDLTFERVLSEDGKDYSLIELYKVTAMASRNVRGVVRSATYTGYIFLRNT